MKANIKFMAFMTFYRKVIAVLNAYDLSTFLDLQNPVFRHHFLINNFLIKNMCLFFASDAPFCQ